jgi:hypothetical protein
MKRSNDCLFRAPRIYAADVAADVAGELAEELACRDRDDVGFDFRFNSRAHYCSPKRLDLLLVPSTLPAWMLDPSLLPKRPPTATRPS